MTTKDDWKFRAEYLEAQSRRLENEAHEKRQEAARFRFVAMQARSTLTKG
jgi:hypothetical protein